jgi:amino acid transporter
MRQLLLSPAFAVFLTSLVMSNKNYRRLGCLGFFFPFFFGAWSMLLHFNAVTDTVINVFQCFALPLAFRHSPNPDPSFRLRLRLGLFFGFSFALIFLGLVLSGFFGIFKQIMAKLFALFETAPRRVLSALVGMRPRPRPKARDQSRYPVPSAAVWPSSPGCPPRSSSTRRNWLGCR